MTPPRRRLRALAAALLAVLLAALVAACGGGDEATAGPSTEDRHCEAYRDFFDERAQQDRSTTDAEVVATLKRWGARLAEIGAPESMPDEAREGHRIWSGLIAEVPDDADQAGVVALESGLDARELSQVKEFFVYNDSTCLGSGTRDPGGALEESP